MSEIPPHNRVQAALFRKHALAAVHLAEAAVTAAERADYLEIATEWLQLAEAADGTTKCSHHGRGSHMERPDVEA